MSKTGTKVLKKVCINADELVGLTAGGIIVAGKATDLKKKGIWGGEL